MAKRPIFRENGDDGNQEIQSTVKEISFFITYKMGPENNIEYGRDKIEKLSTEQPSLNNFYKILQASTKMKGNNSENSQQLVGLTQ